MSIAELQQIEEELHLARMDVEDFKADVDHWHGLYEVMRSQAAIDQRELRTLRGRLGDLREDVQCALDELRHDAGNRGAIWRLRRLVARLPKAEPEPAVGAIPPEEALYDYAQ